MHELLARRSIPLSFLQVEFSLLHRQPEINGLLQMCQRMGITLIAYNPLASGLLTGKYSASHPPPGKRGQMYPLSLLVQLEPLIETMRVLGQLHRKTPAQVALNWLIRKGAFPIPGVKTAAQVLENVGACGWFLSDEEMTVLDMLTTPEV